MTWLRIIIAGLALAGLAYLAWWDATHPEITFFRAFLVAQAPSLAALLAIALRGYSIAQGGIPYPAVLRANGLALSGSLVVPARLSELGKPFYFYAIAGYPRTRGMALVVEERVWDFVAVAGLCIVTLVLAGDRTGNAGLVAAAWTMGALAVAGMVVLFALPRLAHRVPLLARFEAQLGMLRRHSLREVALHLVQSGAIWGLSFSILVIAYAFSGLPRLDLLQLLFLFVASTLGLVVSVTPGGLGTYEGSIVAVLASYGVGWDAALAFAVGFRFCWMLLPLAAGLAALWIDGPVLARRRAREDDAP